MVTITNEWLSVNISPKGAELQSITHLNNNLQYLWSGDAAFWGKKSPVLFPIVGGLKNNQYLHNGKMYNMSRHGFARDMQFAVLHQDAQSVTFGITHNDASLQQYPFEFKFNIQYSLSDNTLVCTYIVANTGQDMMCFSVGAHPAFNVPLVDGTRFEDYYLEFNQTENCGIHPLSAEGLIETNATPFLNNSTILSLEKSLFHKDALVFKSLTSTAISIKSDVTPHGLTVGFEDFPYMGIWSAKDADFVCIEPWCGIADSVNTTGILKEKVGIHHIKPNETFQRSWSVQLF